MKTPLILIILTSGLVIPGISMAEVTLVDQANNHLLTGSVALGFLAGESKEFIYHPTYGGKKASELDWKIDSAVILKGDLSYDLFSHLTAGIRGWTTLTSGNGTLDDYDWVNDNQAGWSHWSHHKKTDLNYANEIDLNLIGWMIKTPDYKLGATLGYQKTRFSWSGYGGYFDYDDEQGGRDIFTIPDSEKIFGYQQSYSMPYIGLVGAWRYKDLEVGGIFKFSNLVQAKSNDNHYARDLTVRTKGRNSLHFSAVLNAGYYILPQTKLYAEAAYIRNEESKSGMEWRVADSTTHYDGDWSGMDNKYYTLSLGIQHTF
ncbi:MULTISPECIES: omptin family outer membrane protease [Pectobacterium]|uniref:omptin family outer membrane protease n=1 Tax=Pectobacterium TaxID=122277 RepID=UPI001BFFCDB8|nr:MULTISPECIES: omptin family outer membrane protease [Pectobacterium]MBT9186098.1 omptin family outer membrane protease [Pectobacterium punjabense]MCE9732594.1 protease [Pectobacterium sp. IFB5596]MDG0798807.1 omptin family outer membrane protease [Pectobacterium punjabense]GKW10858.1 coagulase/fibrinolysin [Pectobacterium carotovorum subsp. carotovorum]